MTTTTTKPTTTARLQCAPTAITLITPMLARRMDITDLATSSVEFSSALARGITATTAGTSFRTAGSTATDFMAGDSMIGTSVAASVGEVLIAASADEASVVGTVFVAVKGSGGDTDSAAEATSAASTVEEDHMATEATAAATAEAASMVEVDSMAEAVRMEASMVAEATADAGNHSRAIT